MTAHDGPGSVRSDARKRDDERRAEAEPTVPGGVDVAAIRARAEAATYRAEPLADDALALCDEVERLRAWKAEALPVIGGLQNDLAAARATIARVEALADEWERRGEYGDATLTEFARALRAALAGTDEGSDQ